MGWPHGLCLRTVWGYNYDNDTYYTTLYRFNDPAIIEACDGDEQIIEAAAKLDLKNIAALKLDK